jgi:hypothetical protein
MKDLYFRLKFAWMVLMGRPVIAFVTFYGDVEILGNIHAYRSTFCKGRVFTGDHMIDTDGVTKKRPAGWERRD